MDKINKDNDAYYLMCEDEDAKKSSVKKYRPEKMSASEVIERIAEFIKKKDSLAVEKHNDLASNLSNLYEKGVQKGKTEAYREIYEYLEMINSFN